MSDVFKLRVDVGTSHIELEGEGTLVHTIFSELREHGLGKLSSINPAKDSLQEEDISDDLFYHITSTPSRHPADSRWSPAFHCER